MRCDEYFWLKDYSKFSLRFCSFLSSMVASSSSSLKFLSWSSTLSPDSVYEVIWVKTSGYLGIIELAFYLVFSVEKLSDASHSVISYLLNQFRKFLSVSLSEAAWMGRYDRDKGWCFFVVELVKILQVLVHFWNCKNHAQFKLTIYK